ncbi:hypothetical protein EMIHUDRAFT_453443 [Emiliania huxleyi CCMP1516]|uniref:NAD(P)(+)--arginine ADP-ribosyltransferase n=2 Tax=Emiliania huxleyi TaxID=2903 RepID=A0A0D3I5P1_EMIH1|nr:hypothetical protein EMIHUDRAFT_453443 [Emiliania huxleyi CCMP1516]EOD06576.1 hypothetical protein EMIHUDRAFT_453443 [Emiliania huxleyi CCMP1516]|eukprot:XP_005759005.1 hypothetical protein EMIHUDRAFT_453443 [Emiliania huxleyi CCMP1516]
MGVCGSKQDVVEVATASQKPQKQDSVPKLLPEEAAAEKARDDEQEIGETSLEMINVGGIETDAPGGTQRRGYLVTVADLVGPPPSDRTWRDEFAEALSQADDLTGEAAAAAADRRRGNENIRFYLREAGGGVLGEAVDDLVANGWAQDDAELVTLLPSLATASLRRALAEGRRDLGASCHALVRVLAERAAAQGEVAPPLYMALRGVRRGDRPLHGMVEDEPGFAGIEVPDATNFRGLTALSPLNFAADPVCMGEEGYHAQVQEEGGELVHLPGDVVCILSQPNDAAGYHTAVLTQYDPPSYVLPPNTLLRLVKVEGPPFTATFRRWTPWCTDADGDRATYDHLTGTSYFDKGDHYEDQDGNRVDCPYDAAATIEKTAYVRGTDELTRGLAHTMEHEWTRAGLAWKDWKGVEYTGRAVWGYVSGAAFVAECTPGMRDVRNVGMRPADFLKRANDHVKSRLPRATAADLLTLDEVLSIRLYTGARLAQLVPVSPRTGEPLLTEACWCVRHDAGPAFDMINWWLRQVACLPNPPPRWHPQLTGAWTAERGRLEPEAARRAAALDAASSFGATVGHLVAALRKLAAANTADENERTLYRCMKGAISGSFWLPDAQGIVCAVDSAFMSTALAPKTFYMDAKGKPSVLLELRARGQDDAGYHCGAEVAFLSQFEGEQEVILPPLTMLQVMPRHPAPADLPPPPAEGSSADAVVAWSRMKHDVTWERTEDEKDYERIVAVPTFTG